MAAVTKNRNFFNFFWSHIDKTVKKPNSTLGFLRRYLKVSNQDTKTAAYKTLVRPTIEYYSSVWSPHTKDAISKKEMVQRRAARYLINRHRNTSSVPSSNWCWQCIPNTGGLWEETVCVVICGC
jgi:hypothetical protein